MTNQSITHPPPVLYILNNQSITDPLSGAVGDKQSITYPPLGAVYTK
jgi:hypothetical protein